ncbi:A/G-specific adenine glycosylase [Cnuella takakiae]|nr:A/G-specific adenine glycosylase [Cnuella takakiae]
MDNAQLLERGYRFGQELLAWNSHDNKRQMPWKGEKDPYKIWLSEIMLQQTRVEQGLPYFEKFIAAYPTIRQLADAPDQEVFKLWEGLGYYSRCRNLLATARYIAYELDGIFPNKYEDILALKGVGPYTAAAIASFAYNLHHAVLDGNVYRVLSRIHGIGTPTDSAVGKNLFTTLAQAQLPDGKAAAYNQGIMDFGATVCKPLPECSTCFFADDCVAFQTGRQLALPIKEKQLQVSDRFFFYLVLEHEGKVAVRQRQAKDIWLDLFEFLLIETPEPASWQLVAAELEHAWGLSPESYQRVGTRYVVKQRLTHQLVHLSFERLALNHTIELPQLQWADKAALENFPFPKAIKEYVLAEL